MTYWSNTLVFYISYLYPHQSIPVSLINVAHPIAWCGAPKSTILILWKDHELSTREMIASVPLASAATTLRSVPINVTTESARRTWPNAFSPTLPLPKITFDSLIGVMGVILGSNYLDWPITIQECVMCYSKFLLRELRQCTPQCITVSNPGVIYLEWSVRKRFRVANRTKQCPASRQSRSRTVRLVCARLIGRWRPWRTVDKGRPPRSL